MEIVADLHLHSKFSRAVSPQMVIPQMAKWAKIKGIDLLGTGDFTHSQWLSELKENLDEKDGVLEMRSESGSEGEGGVRFLLTTEISSIYSQSGKTRKIHSIIIAPSFSVVEKINKELTSRGCNLKSDGRPIIGISAKNLLELLLGVDEKCLLVPAHIWTPWFSLFGSKSGFDSIEECFGDLAKYIYGVETGLSSDPQMNWKIKDLDGRSILSFSDAHSPSKLGRESTMFEMEKLNYDNIRQAIMGEGEKLEVSREMRVGSGEIKISSHISHPHVSYTIEFYPEEGKYHYTGHRNCGIIFSPEDTVKKGTTCPVCGKKMTEGVLERVREMSKGTTSITGTTGKNRTDELGVRWFEKEGRAPYVSLVPLVEIIAESLGVGQASKKVEEEYFRLIKSLGNELEILMKLKLAEIEKVAGQKITEGIGKVRKGNIFIRPGYDGEFGKVKVWPVSKGEDEKLEMKVKKEQLTLLGG